MLGNVVCQLLRFPRRLQSKKHVWSSASVCWGHFQLHHTSSSGWWADALEQPQPTSRFLVRKSDCFLEVHVMFLLYHVKQNWKTPPLLIIIKCLRGILKDEKFDPSTIMQFELGYRYENLEKLMTGKGWFYTRPMWLRRQKMKVRSRSYMAILKHVLLCVPFKNK